MKQIRLITEERKMKIGNRQTKTIFIALSLMLPCASGRAAEKPKVETSPETSSLEWQARTRIAQQQDMGESAPDWLMNSESYAVGYDQNEWDALAQSKVSFITHCPVNREFFTRARALGIRTFPYVTFYHANAHGGANMFFTSVDLREHPEWIEVDEEGNRKRSAFWASEDMKNEYLVCPNVQGYQDAMVAYVRNLMEMGADGVFVDVLTTRQACSGPKFGKHQHLYEDQNHAFAMLLKRVREEIKKFRPDGALLGNSGNIPALPPEYVRYMDADMAESYILTWVSTERRFDWKDYWLKKGQDLQPYIRAGKAIQALSFLGHTPYGIREDAFFAYASARLSGLVWNGGLPLGNPETADIYRLRLGKPLTDEREENGVYYRAFERGLVAVNPNKEKALSFTIAAPVPTTRLVDVFGGGAREWKFYGDGYRVNTLAPKFGSASLVASNATAVQRSGAVQHIEVNQQQPKPLILSGWSKAQNVSGTPSGEYSLYIDAQYTDGTPLFGQIAAFDCGTHDWQEKSFTIDAPKPIRSLSLYTMFRNKSGTVWFDNVSLREEGGEELVRNGGFEDKSRDAIQVDVSKTGGKLEIPAYSGRVFLYGADTTDQVARTGPTLTIKTAPALGEVRFRVDGFDMWTHSGRWTTQYILGPYFGGFEIHFDKPGKHTIEIVDVVPDDMKTPAGYGAGEKLGESMNPSNPTQPSDGRKFRFRDWEGLGKNPKIEIDVSANTTITANFDVDAPK
jgi:hypothetical protein